jgi:predicted NAD/FAD-dependent oxidoreductase
VGTEVLIALPAPSWPALFSPQHHSTESVVSAHVAELEVATLITVAIGTTLGVAIHVA